MTVNTIEEDKWVIQDVKNERVVSLPCQNPRRRDHQYISTNSRGVTNSGVNKFEDNSETYSSIVCNQNHENGLELVLIRR